MVRTVGLSTIQTPPLQQSCTVDAAVERGTNPDTANGSEPVSLEGGDDWGDDCAGVTCGRRDIPKDCVSRAFSTKSGLAGPKELSSISSWEIPETSSALWRIQRV
jgi:hypothetical protein